MILALLIGGLAAVVTSSMLPSLLSPENTWSESRAVDHQKISERIQMLAGSLEKAASAAEKKRITAELDEAQATRNGLQGSLEGSFSRPFWLSIVVLVAGIGLTAGGFCLYYFVPMPVEKKPTLAELDPDGTLAEKELTALDYRNAVRQSRGKHKSRH